MRRDDPSRGEAYPPPVGGSTTGGGARRAGLIIGLTLAALFIVSSAAVVVGQMLAPSTVGTAPTLPTSSDNSSSTTTPNERVDSPSAQAQSISSLLVEARASRQGVISAVADVDNCRDLPGAIRTLSRVEAERESELSRANQLSTSQLPNGSQLRYTLAQALNASLIADQYYLAWAQNVADCSGRPLYTDNYVAAGRASAQATAAKRDFAAMWNSIAGTYQLSTVREQDF